MKTYKKILCPIVFSDFSQAQVRPTKPLRKAGKRPLWATGSFR